MRTEVLASSAPAVMATGADRRANGEINLNGMSSQKEKLQEI